MKHSGGNIEGHFQPKSDFCPNWILDHIGLLAWIRVKVSFDVPWKSTRSGGLRKRKEDQSDTIGDRPRWEADATRKQKSRALSRRESDATRKSKSRAAVDDSQTSKKQIDATRKKRRSRVAENGSQTLQKREEDIIANQRRSESFGHT